MAICSDFERVFEIGPLFRAEHAHARGLMTEFVGLDLEMSFSHHYHEVCYLTFYYFIIYFLVTNSIWSLFLIQVLDVIDKLFVGIFEGLQTKFARELQVVGQQYPFEPIQFLKPSLRLNYIEGISLLRGAGHKIDDTDYLRYLNTCNTKQYWPFIVLLKRESLADWWKRSTRLIFSFWTNSQKNFVHFTPWLTQKIT